MPWTMNDYPNTWKNFDELERKKAIDIGNAMLKMVIKKAMLYRLLHSKLKIGIKMRRKMS